MKFMNNIIRTVKRVMKYSDFKNIENVEGVKIKKGEYFPDMKSIEIYVLIDDTYMDIAYSRGSLNLAFKEEECSKVLEHLKNTPDERVIFANEFAKILKENKIYSDVVGWMDPLPDTSLKQMQRWVKAGKYTQQDFEKLVELREKYCII